MVAPSHEAGHEQAASRRVVVVGSINRDLVIHVGAHPRPGETVSGSDLREFPGGKGGNQAVAARRAGVETLLIGATGRDGFGTAMRAFYAAEGIDLAHVASFDHTPTGIAVILVDRNAENTVTVASGANAALTPDFLADVVFQAGDIVVSQFEVPDAVIMAAFEKAKAAGAQTLLNPAPMKTLTPALLTLTDCLVLNETELEAASGYPNLTSDTAVEAAAASLRGPEAVIVTLGAKGCLATTRIGTIRLTGETVAALDTTGAGDCFVGVLAAGLAAGFSLETALVRANRAAAISVTRHGAASSMPYAHEIQYT